MCNCSPGSLHAFGNTHVAPQLANAQHALRSVHQAEFYDVYRPLLAGWASTGLRLRGTTPANDVVVHWKGPSAGQTAILILLDLVLGVEHRHHTATFQQEMRAYLPAPHALLLQARSREMASALLPLTLPISGAGHGCTHRCKWLHPARRSPC